MRGSQFIEKLPPKKFSEIFWRQALLGEKALSAGIRLSFLPRKALRNPRISHFALKGVQSLHQQTKSPQIASFCRGSLSTTEALRQALSVPFRPKYPVFQHFLAHKKCFPRDFRDQFPDFARLSCIGKGLPKNMARILRGVKSPFAPSTGGGSVFLFPFPWALPCPACPLWGFIRGAFLELARIRALRGL